MLLHEKVLQEKLRDKGTSWFMEQAGYAERLDYLARRSNLSQVKKVTDYDKIVVGQQMQMFENYLGFIKETQGSTNSLGQVPTLGLDAISGIYGDSLIPLVGTTQNLKERQGIIWYRQTKAGDTRGNLTQDQLIRDSRQATAVFQSGYAQAKQVQQLSITTPGVTTYNLSLQGAPIRPKSVLITVPNMGLLDGVDDGKGKFYGDNMQATVNYANGVAILKLLVTPTGTDPIYVEWESDFETSGDIPRLQTFMDSDIVKAEIIALRGETSLYKDYDMSMRFGQAASQDMLNTLIREVTAEINYRAANMIYNAAVGVTEFDPVPGTGVSFYEHKQGFMTSWNFADTKILTQLGRGRVTRVLAGSLVCAMFADMPKFVPSNIDADGPHVFGTIDNKIIIRCPQYPALEAIGMYHGTGMFDTPFVYCPYMPLYVDGSIPSPDNIVIKNGLVTTWAGFKVVVPRMITKFRLTQEPKLKATA